MPELIYLSSDDGGHGSDGGSDGDSNGGSGDSGGSDPFHNSPPTNMVSHTHAPVGNTHEVIDGLLSFMAVRMRDLALESHGAPEP